MTISHRSLSARAAAAVLVLGLAAPAVAQPDPAPAPAKVTKPAKGAKPPRFKTIIIEEEVLEGGVPTGQIIPVDARGFRDHTSLIRIRHSFVDKILQSAENL